MRTIVIRLSCLLAAVAPFVAITAQQPQAPQLAEQAYTDIEVFKGVPASDIIPAMQFMSASMNYKCTDCHVENDYAADHKKKDESRKMVLMQREINKNHFNGRLEVTCFTCHNKKGHPDSMPLPAGVERRHDEMDPPPAPNTLLAKHAAKTGSFTTPIVRTGTVTAPNDVTRKIETLPLTATYAPGGKFRLDSGERKLGSDGKQAWYGLYPLADEPAAIMNRMGRTWIGDADFKGLTRLQVNGKSKIGTADVIVVQGYRASTVSAEELYFDAKTGLLLRMVNFRRSTIGTVASVIDYSNYVAVGTMMLPQKVVATTPEGDRWIMDFKATKSDPSVKDSIFSFGG